MLPRPLPVAALPFKPVVAENTPEPGLVQLKTEPFPVVAVLVVAVAVELDALHRAVVPPRADQLGPSVEGESEAEFSPRLVVRVRRRRGRGRRRAGEEHRARGQTRRRRRVGRV